MKRLGEAYVPLRKIPIIYFRSGGTPLFDTYPVFVEYFFFPPNDTFEPKVMSDNNWAPPLFVVRGIWDGTLELPLKIC